jgi:hypothetical protein
MATDQNLPYPPETKRKADSSKSLEFLGRNLLFDRAHFRREIFFTQPEMTPGERGPPVVR